MIIQGPTSNGAQLNTTKVTDDGQLQVFSEATTFEWHQSFVHGEVYTAICNVTIAASPTQQNIAFLRNDSTSKRLVVLSIDVQAIVTGGTAFPSVLHFFTVATGTTYTSGGTEITPRAINFASGVSSPTTIYDGGSAITLGGTVVPIDQWYLPASADHYTFKGDGIVLGTNDAISVHFDSDGTGGDAQAIIRYATVEEAI